MKSRLQHLVVFDLWLRQVLFKQVVLSLVDQEVLTVVIGTARNWDCLEASAIVHDSCSSWCLTKLFIETITDHLVAGTVLNVKQAVTGQV